MISKLKLNGYLLIWSKGHIKVTIIALVALNLFPVAKVNAKDFLVGSATADITPALPVSLVGQMYSRTARTAATPLYAGVVAMESREGNISLDQAIFVSCDMVAMPVILIEMVRKEVARQLPGFDVKKIILSATHTHTGPAFSDGGDDLPKGVSTPAEFRTLFTERVSTAIVNAWKNRTKGSVSWSLTTAVVAQNRRAVYKDSTAVMYGKTDSVGFQNFEGFSDHNINTLFFWNDENKLIATSVDVACPAQEVESDTVVNADYWHEVRLGLKKHFGQDLNVVAWIGAGGDQSPHLMFMKKADERMMRLTKQTRKEAIARRIVNAVIEGYEAVKNDRYTGVTLSHKAETVPLPANVITESEFRAVKKLYDAAMERVKNNLPLTERETGRLRRNTSVIERYEKQKTSGPQKYETEIHLVRIGDIVVFTNQFEFYTDFGLRIQARSKALQTFIVQLAGPGSYLPTAKAIRAGGYSAQGNTVGPEGGQALVDIAVKMIDELWAEKK